MRHSVYLSLGSNLGDRGENLKRAIAALTDAGVKVTRVSSLYESEPVDFAEQPWFVNAAVQGETQLSPLELLRALQGIEAEMGRVKSVPKGPRVIDIDILLYDDDAIEKAELQIPHPRMHLRRFVLVPLNEIAGGVRHPQFGATVAELLERTPDRSEVRPLRGDEPSGTTAKS